MSLSLDIWLELLLDLSFVFFWLNCLSASLTDELFFTFVGTLLLGSCSNKFSNWISDWFSSEVLHGTPNRKIYSF